MGDFFIFLAVIGAGGVAWLASNFKTNKIQMRAVAPKVTTGTTVLNTEIISGLNTAFDGFFNADAIDYETPRSKAQGILDLIGKHESGDNYNIVYGGKIIGLTQMTVKEVSDWQRANNPSGPATAAAGRYQIINKTLNDLIDVMGLNGREKFNEQIQDDMAYELLKRRGWESYIEGRLSQSKMMENLAKEWASFPKDKSGRSYYAGDGINKALVSVNSVLSELNRSKGIA